MTQARLRVPHLHVGLTYKLKLQMCNNPPIKKPIDLSSANYADPQVSKLQTRNSFVLIYLRTCGAGIPFTFTYLQKNWGVPPFDNTRKVPK
jgi:hypothetical protein